MQTFRSSLLVIVFSYMSVGTVLSQWVRTNGPLAGQIYALASKTDGTLLAATQTGISRTTDNGNSWVLKNNGLAGGAMYSLGVSPTGSIFGWSFMAGIFRSTNDGDNWSRVYASLAVVWGFAIKSSGTIFAGTDFQGVVRSTDGGTNWTQVGLTNRDVLSLPLPSTPREMFLPVSGELVCFDRPTMVIAGHRSTPDLEISPSGLFCSTQTAISLPARTTACIVQQTMEDHGLYQESPERLW